MFFFRSPLNPFSTATKPLSPSLNVKPIKQEKKQIPVQKISKQYTVVPIKKSLPRPNIPEPESNDFDEVDGMDVETVDSTVQGLYTFSPRYEHLDLLVRMKY